MKSRAEAARRALAVVDISDEESEDDLRGPLGLGNRELPIEPSSFVAGSGAAGPDASFRSWGPMARDEFCKSCFIKDSGAIPDKAKLTPDKCCSQLHWGVCKQADSAVIDVITGAAACLWEHLWTSTKGSSSCAFQWIRVYIGRCRTQGDIPLHVTPPGPLSSEHGLLLYVALLRGAAPRLALFPKGH